ncbi:MAG: polyprenyl synthetase, partial [Alistipes sp.]|nr:polyprenyl synthetase [Alistipes sp.]
MAPSEDFIAEMIEAQNVKEFLRQQHQELLEKALARVTVLAEEYRQRAIEALESINNMELKRLLFRVTARILK